MIRVLIVCAILLACAAPPAQAQAPAPSSPAAAQTPAIPKPGTVIRDCPECPEMVAVPPGIFIMGSPKGEKHERPTRPVRVAKAFAIGKYEVTFDEWEIGRAPCRERV